MRGKAYWAFIEQGMDAEGKDRMTVNNDHRMDDQVRSNKRKATFVSIIDDEENVRSAVGSLVRSLGYSIETFASAEDFLESEAKAVTSCVISDIKMPGMNGIDLYNLLRTRGENVPFIFMTAFAEETARTRLGDQIGILEKPFSADLLANFLEQVQA